jgi:uncharacterized membrane protein YcaP (DUF421 family)
MKQYDTVLYTVFTIYFKNFIINFNIFPYLLKVTIGDRYNECTASSRISLHCTFTCLGVCTLWTMLQCYITSRDSFTQTILQTSQGPTL